MALLNMKAAPHGGEIRLLPESRTARRIEPTALLYHSIVGTARGAYNYFLRNSSLESTLLVDKKGWIIQAMDTEVQADANYQANAWAGSVETEDNGQPDSDPWTPNQLDALVWIAHEYQRLHGLKLRRLPPGSREGIGYHSMEGAPSRLTPVKGKTCPGRVRIMQFERELLPRIISGRNIPAPKPKEWDEMATKDEIKQAVREVLNEATPYGQRSFADGFKAAYDRLGQVLTKLGTGGGK